MDGLSDQQSFDLSDLEESGSIGGSRIFDNDDDEQEGNKTRSSVAAVTAYQRRQEGKDAPHSLGKRETWIVRRLKIILLSLLICATISTSVATFYLFTRQESNLYETQFNGFAATLVESFHRSTSQKLWAANLLSTAFTSFAQRTDQKYPNMTLSDWPFITAGARRLANASAVTFSPLLYTDQYLAEWEAYTTSDDPSFDSSIPGFSTASQPGENSRSIEDGIYAYEGENMVDYEGPGLYAPIWQISPEFNNSGSKMYNQMAGEGRREAIENLIQKGGSVFSRVLHEEPGPSPPHIRGETPRSIIYYVVADSFASRKLAGVIGVEFDWESYFGQKFPDQFNGMVIVLESTAGQSFTFTIIEGEVRFSANDDQHDTKFDSLVLSSEYEAFHALCHYGLQFLIDTYTFGRRVEEEDFSELPLVPLGPLDSAYDLEGDHTIHYRIKVYPSQAFKRNYVTSDPQFFAIGVAGIFVCTSAIFILYDRFVEKRQRVTMETAERSSAVVNSLFPENVRERLFKNAEERQGSITQSKTKHERNHGMGSSAHSRARRMLPEPAKLKLKSFLDRDENGDLDGDDVDLSLSPPIADLFPHTTVLFADIVGFTAWSSEREPAQVFRLLETLYQKFDRLAEKLNVFKVETIGDCYVAVTGLPEPNKEHAVIMSRFAWEIKLTMHDACKKLEYVLGPGTADLCLRIGLHSGPVTAGVLRGDKSRFQLFGDTMNTAARMESLSVANRIQVSETTASFLISHGKQHWLTPRDGGVEAKGKGSLQTYWLRPTKRHSSNDSHSDHSPYESNYPSSLARSSISSDGEWTPVSCFRRAPSTANKSKPVRSVPNSRRNVPLDGTVATNEKKDSLISWNVDVLVTNLQKVVAMRHNSGESRRRKRNNNSVLVLNDVSQGTTPMEELTEIIELPDFDGKNASQKSDLALIDADVEAQLRKYVTKIASMYRDNPFHNLEHASHVTMSANKLMNRIVVPKDVNYAQGSETQRTYVVKLAKNVHNSTFGISSDALTQFAIVFSALIHDVDHTGLTNAQLVEEGADVAVVYKGQSVAEQNSVAIAWALLLEPQYERLFMTICPTTTECMRFRQLVVTAVLATDIIDSELQQHRKKRWYKTFEVDAHSSTVDKDEDVNRKATIVIEHLIQASDVAHTMQHWHIYCKWSEKLFQEKYLAFVSGHEKQEPSESWYENELGFFDHYVIPLAKKLKECGVFGVSSDEYLGFAVENRMEWEMKGKDVVAAVLRRAQSKYGFRVPCTNQPDEGDEAELAEY